MSLFKPNVQKLQKAKDVSGLIKALDFKDAEIRIDSCRALRIIGDTHAVEPIILALKDTDDRVRREAIYALGELKDPRAAEALLAVISDKSLFAVTTQALAKSKEPRLFDHLVNALENEELRASAVYALGELGDPRAVKLLVPMLKHDDIGVRQAAIYALFRIQIQYPEAINELRDAAARIREAIEDPDAYVRQWVITVLNKIPEALDKVILIKLLHDPDITVRESAAYKLDKFGIPDDPLERAWYAAAHHEWDMAYELGQIAREPLMQATQTKVERNLVGAAVALAKLGDRRAVEQLISCLKFALSKPDVYEMAVKALGKYGDTRAIQPLKELGAASTAIILEPGIRGLALDALFKLERTLDKKVKNPPKCLSCQSGIPALNKTIADDIRAGGGMVIGAGLDATLYDGLICRRGCENGSALL